MYKNVHLRQVVAKQVGKKEGIAIRKGRDCKNRFFAPKTKRRVNKQEGIAALSGEGSDFDLI